MIFQMCVKCQQPMSNGFDDYADDDEQYDEVMGRLGKDANVTNLWLIKKFFFKKISFNYFSHGYGGRR